MTMPSKNRLKFDDKENKLLVKDLGKLVDSTPVNNAVSAAQQVSETALAKMADASSALKSLQSPMNDLVKTLGSGQAASQMLASIEESLPSGLPDMRSVAASVNGVIQSGQEQASRLTQTVMGTINESLAQVPAALGKVNQISSGVKSYLLKNSLMEYAREGLKAADQAVAGAKSVLQAGQKLERDFQQAGRSITAIKQQLESKLTSQSSSVVASAKSVLQTTQKLEQGFQQASRSITAAKQRFDPVPTVPTPNVVSTQSQLTAQRIMETLNTPAGAPNTEMGTTSKLLPISSPDGTPATSVDSIQDIKHSNHALLILMGGVTWYRSLYTYLYDVLQSSHIAAVYGRAADHYAALSGQGTDKQNEQLRNFNSIVTTNTPDNPNKNLFVYKQFQTVLAYLMQDLPNLPDKSRVYAVLAYLGQLLPVIALKDLVTQQDYDRLSSQVDREISLTAGNAYESMTAEQVQACHRDMFNILVTDAVVAHRGQNEKTDAKLLETSSEIALYCGVWMMREFLMTIIKTTDLQVRARLVVALETIYNTQIEQMTFAYTDFHELVRQGLPIYYRPSSKAFSQLSFVFIKHYHLNRTAILQTRKYLSSDQEKTAFDALTMRLDALIENPTPQVQAVLDNATAFNSTAMTEQQLEMGRQLSSSVIDTQRLVTDASNFPPRTFERYYISPDQLYFDNTVAIMR